MTNFTRTSDTEWTWLDGTHNRSVRYFPNTGRLIWSGWVMSSEGPVFQPGLAQESAHFLEQGPAVESVPSDLIVALREVLQPPAPKPGLLDRLRGLL